MRKVTIQRIAELANVSTTTVSYVLNNRPGISQKTRDRVLQIMEQENYTPNSSAALPQRSRNIFLVIDELVPFGNLFYSAIVDTATVAAAKYGYNIVVSNKLDSFLTSTAARAIRQGSADGLIFLHDIEPEILIFLHQEQVPFVVIDAHRQDSNYSRICADYELSAYTAARHLIELGHEKIGFIGERAVPDFYTATFNGFCRALTENCLSVHPAWLQSEACDIASASGCMANILKFNELPTGIVCATDQFALSAMHCAQDHGYQIPKDFSFIGIDDLNISQLYYPALTTIRIDSYEMAERAIDLLCDFIENSPPDSPVVYTVKSDTLICRDSTAAPAH